jgi:hypothetical protein
MIRSKELLLTACLAAVFVLTASSASAGPYIDPQGDTFGPGPNRPDIGQYSATSLGPDNLVIIKVAFYDPVSAPSLFHDAANPSPSVVGYIDLDTDFNSATGRPSHINTTPGVPGPPIALGADYWLDLFSEALPGHAGKVDLIKSTGGLSGTVVAEVPIVFGAQDFTITFNLADIGNPTGGAFNYGILMGNFSGATDRAPNGADPAQADVVPEPASITLLCFGLAALAGYRHRLRRRVA